MPYFEIKWIPKMLAPKSGRDDVELFIYFMVIHWIFKWNLLSSRMLFCEKSLGLTFGRIITLSRFHHHPLSYSRWWLMLSLFGTSIPWPLARSNNSRICKYSSFWFILTIQGKRTHQWLHWNNFLRLTYCIHDRND